VTALEVGPIQLFGTAYDPSDLPGSSVDPLGFEAGYVALAEALVPGLTTITDAPRYPGMLCAGLHLAHGEADGQTPRVAAEEKCLSALFRLERLWAVASVLRWRQQPEERDDSFGTLRGITYAELQVERIEDRGLTEISPDFRFLRRQRITGAVGVYRNFLEKCGLVFENEWRLTPDLGEALGEAFVRGTVMPAAVKRSMLEGANAPVAALRAWGQYAQPTRALLEEEKRVLREAVLASFQRRVTLGLLRQVGPAWLQAAPDGELHAVAEMLRLIKAGKAVRGVPPEVMPPLCATLTVIPAYEAAYRAALLGFERVLWLVRESPGGTASDAVLRDGTVRKLPKLLRETADGLAAALDGAAEMAQPVRDALTDATSFVQDLGQRAREPKAAIEAILERHKQVQEGKLDRGHRKAPWVVEDAGAYRLTFARVGGLNRPVTEPAQIVPHNYRLRNARRFLAALEIGA